MPIPGGFSGQTTRSNAVVIAHGIEGLRLAPFHVTNGAFVVVPGRILALQGMHALVCPWRDARAVEWGGLENR